MKNKISEIATLYYRAIGHCGWNAWYALFFFDGMKSQHDAILESFGKTEVYICSLTRLPSTINSSLSTSTPLFKFKSLFFPFFLLEQFIESQFFLIIEIIPAQILS